MTPEMLKQAKELDQKLVQLNNELKLWESASRIYTIGVIQQGTSYQMFLPVESIDFAILKDYVITIYKAKIETSQTKFDNL
jgi:hypothetical protein